MSFYKRTGELIFGTRLKRVSDKFLMDVSKIYKSLEIPFETSWFPLFYLLNERGELSVTEIAKELEITHSAISQLVGILEKKKLIKFIDDKNDRRKRLIYFTPQGLKLIKILIPIWGSIKRQMEEMLKERENSRYLLLALDELEEQIEKKNLYLRVMNDLKKSQSRNITIVPYHSQCQGQFKNLILNWFIENYNTKLPDTGLINHPEGKIRDGKCIILMAKAEDECIGTIVAEIKEKRNSEILYIIVDEEWQKRGIGEKLLFEMIKQLQNRGIKNIYVRLDRKFTHAIKLFKKAGFSLKTVKHNRVSSEFKNTILLMELNLS